MIFKILTILYFIDVVYNGFVTLSDKSFEAALNDPTSSEYTSLALSMESGLEDIFCDGTYSDCTLKVTGFREGSVITDFSVIVVLPKESEADPDTETPEKVKEHLDAKMSGLAATITDDNLAVAAGTLTPGNLHTE